MSEPSQIDIPISKSKGTLTLVGALVFVVMGSWITLEPERFVNRITPNPETVFVIGLIGTLFFGFMMFIIIQKLLDKRVGLSISDKGIVNNSQNVDIGLIEWVDITGIETVYIRSTPFLVLTTDKPEKYISRAKNRQSKWGVKASMNHYGSPIVIISNSLKVSFGELEQMVRQEYDRHKKVE